MYHAPRRQGRERNPLVRRNRPWRPMAESLESRLVLSTFLVTNPSDNLAPGSLRYAITQANLPGNEGSTVKFTPQVAGPIVLTGGELSISDNMTIRNDSGAPLEIRQSTATAPEEPVVRTLAAAYVDLVGREPTYAGVPGSTDGTILHAQKGIPIVTCGPGHRLIPHQVDEYVDVAELVDAARIYVAAALAYLTP